MANIPLKDNKPLQITEFEARAIAKFIDAMIPGLLYVKCKGCEQVKSGTHAKKKTEPHPSQPNARVDYYYCKDCA